jgi:hypothetical protein
MKHRGGKGRGQSIPAAVVGASSTRAPPPPAAGLARPGGRRVRWAERAPPAPARDGRGREALATGASERPRMGHMAAARQSGIRVRDVTDGVAAARRCGGEEGPEEIKKVFFLFLE